MWFGNDDTMQGFGGPSATEGTDGQLYQWVEGVDGLGTPVGCWRRVKGQASQAPYRRSLAPFLGELAEGSDGNMYQWVQGVDGLGSALGFWKRLRKLAKRALPIARTFAPFVPGGSAALTAATPFLRKVGVEGSDGLGALYEAPDGSMYQVQGVDAGDELDGLADEELQGLAADDELNGLEADDEISGLQADDELNGFAADEELNGFQAVEEMNGFGADEDLNGFAADDELNGVGAEDDISGTGDEEAMSGYVRGRGVSGVEGFIPDRPRETPTFAPSPHAPMWAPLW